MFLFFFLNFRDDNRTGNEHSEYWAKYDKARLVGLMEQINVGSPGCQKAFPKCPLSSQILMDAITNSNGLCESSKHLFFKFHYGRLSKSK